MIEELFTDRLQLSKVTMDDSSSLFKIWSDPDVARFMNIEYFTHEEQAKEMITYLDKLAKESRAIRFSIVDLTSNQVIGSCGYNTLDFENAKFFNTGGMSDEKKRLHQMRRNRGRKFSFYLRSLTNLLL